MRIWKKALSAALSAALLASLAATSAFAALPSYSTTAYLTCTAAASTSTCSQVADGISTVTLTGASATDATHTLYITASGATPIAAGGAFTLAGGTITAPASTTFGAADTITFRSPAAPGTAAVNVYAIDTTTGIAALDGTLTITFTATSGLAVSAANSTVKTLASCAGTTVVTSGSATGTNPVAHLCVTVKDGNGNAVSGASVTSTITPVGNLNAGAGTAQTLTVTSTAAGLADFGIYASGLSGTAAISTSVTVGTTTTTLAPVSFTFTGGVASLQLIGIQTAVALGGDVNGVYFIAKDASGHRISTTGSTAVVTTLTGAGLDNPVNGAPWTDWDGAETSPTATGTRFVSGSGYHDIVCPETGTATSATIAVKNGSVVSNAITVYCSGAADSFSVAFDKSTVAPGGTATISATVKDANGFPVPDGTGVSVVVSSGATLASSDGTKNGVATWTYLAPFNTGVASVIATVAGVSGTQTASINVGTVVVAPGSGGTNASALGVTKSGPFSISTKVAALGKYQTWKLAFGPSAAGKTVAILMASKNSAGVWSSFSRLTSRVADASGNVYFYWRTSSAAWLSVRGSLDSGMTPAVQGRWR